MTTEFTSNTFEDNYILAILEHYKFDLTTAEHDVVREAQITDKYACQLTAFMNGKENGKILNAITVDFYRGGLSEYIYASRQMNQVPRKGDEVVFANCTGTVQAVHWVFTKHSTSAEPYVKVYFI